ncbi:hypothetical protein PIB30_034294 [Stylosanthes scabra]|uniref:Uncharacterized protein n=1 Tax=Stylosanthes scabra TaxID=79078 RepID=A0ABU6ZAH0_9FABA|nr:hypothetical protein [Stylosanthes scabra]
MATLFNNKRVKEEIPAKCEDPDPCLVTCKIKHVVVRENRRRREGQDRRINNPCGLPCNQTRKEGQWRYTASTPGRPFLKSSGFKLNYHDEIFTFEVGNTIEVFHFDDSSKPEKKGIHQLRHDKKNKKKRMEARKRKKREREEADKKGWLIKTKATKGRKEKKKRALSTLEKRKGIKGVERSRFKKNSQKRKKKDKAEVESEKAHIRCSSLSKLFRKLKGLKRLLH